MFDTHCHLNFKRYKKTLDDVISRAIGAGVSQIVIPGTDITSSKKAIEIAEKHEGFYAAVGIHPHHAAKYLSATVANPRDSRLRGNDNSEKISKPALPAGRQVRDDINEIENLLDHPKVVAVGEVGMDRHEYEETKYQEYAVDDRFLEIQKQLLRKQITLAVKYNKSLVLHNREAIDDILPILEESWDEKLAGRTVFHCCEANLQLLTFAKKYHLFIGVDGDVTYDKMKQEFIKEVPIEMLVVETDSPFILPEPLKSEKKYPNEPAYVQYVVEEVAKLMDSSIEEVSQITMENGRRLFNL